VLLSFFTMAASTLPCTASLGLTRQKKPWLSRSSVSVGEVALGEATTIWFWTARSRTEAVTPEQQGPTTAVTPSPANWLNLLGSPEESVVPSSLTSVVMCRPRLAALISSTARSAPSRMSGPSVLRAPVRGMKTPSFSSRGVVEGVVMTGVEVTGVDVGVEETGVLEVVVDDVGVVVVLLVAQPARMGAPTSASAAMNRIRFETVMIASP